MKEILTFNYLSSRKDWFKYGLVSAVFAFLVGLYGYSLSIASDRICFFIPAPFAAFLVNGLMWKWTFKKEEDYKVGNVISIALIGTPIIHYFTFVLLGLGRIICYELTGDCTDYSGKPESILSVLSYSFFQALITVYKSGIITIAIGILIGYFILKSSKFDNQKS
ncbi:MAG: hypothetical protein IPG39_14650 [Bacteroidetes bacterium]|nr:hypothetical protein [Bacteroidota bacterium]